MFWTFVAVLIALALWFVVTPLRRQIYSTASPRPQEATLGMFKERLAELESDLRRGVLNESDFNAAREELERELLRMTDIKGQAHDGAIADTPRWPATAATVLVPLLSVSLYLVLGGGPRALQAGPIDTPTNESAPVVAGTDASAPAHAQGMSNLSIEEATKQLAARLQRQPEDADGWLLLAKSYGYLGRAAEAADAMTRYSALRPGNSSGVPSPAGDSMNSAKPEVAATSGPVAEPTTTDAMTVNAIIGGRIQGVEAATPAMASAPVAVDSSINALEQKLASHPDDVEGWIMLGHSYQTQRRYSDAAHAFSEAMKHQVSDAVLIADYADALAAANGGWVAGEPANWIDKALAIDPKQPKALWLAATAAGQQSDHAHALQLWKQLQPLVEPGSVDAQTVAANIDESQRALSGVSETSGNNGGRATASNTANAESTNAAMPASASIHGRVTLDPSLASSASAGDTVFIFARAAQGPRMPLAVLRKRVSDLPAEFVLDDSMGMTPSTRLSDYNDVVVGARISKSGDAMSQPGDLEGMSETIHPGAAQPVDIIINKRS